MNKSINNYNFIQFQNNNNNIKTYKALDNNCASFSIINFPYNNILFFSFI